MNSAVVFLAFLVSTCLAVCDEARITSCFVANLDGLGPEGMVDGKISADELGWFIYKEPCGPVMGITDAEYVLHFCDVNKDSFLDASDYGQPMSCTRIAAVRNGICAMCDKCDAAKKK